MNGSLQVLRLEIRSDVAAFAARVAELESLTISPKTTDANLMARAAVALHHAYGAFEAALARIARVFDTEPVGPNWHRSLLETMAMEVHAIRPAIVTPQALPDLRDLLAFRHFFRHAYQVALDPGRLAALRECLDAWLAGLATKT